MKPLPLFLVNGSKGKGFLVIWKVWKVKASTAAHARQYLHCLARLVRQALRQACCKSFRCLHSLKCTHALNWKDLIQYKVSHPVVRKSTRSSFDRQQHERKGRAR